MAKPTKISKIEVRITHEEDCALNTCASNAHLTVSNLVRSYIFDQERIILIEEGAALADSFAKINKDLFHFHKYGQLPDEYAVVLLEALMENLQQLKAIDRRLMEMQRYMEFIRYIGVVRQPGSTKSEKFELRTTAEEKALLRATADEVGMSLSSLVRFMLFGKEKIIVLAKGQQLIRSFIEAHKDISYFYRNGYLTSDMEIILMNNAEYILNRLDSISEKLTDIHSDDM